MRAFVAVDVPALDGPVPDGLRPEDHITLHFFEELPVERIPAVVEAISEATGASGPFELEVRGVGAFPTTRRPRVVWAGVGVGTAELRSLVDRLRTALSARGFRTETRPFVPHLTLARIRSRQGAAWAQRFLTEPEHGTRVWARGTVSEVVLKESELLPTGARHTVRERVPLRGVSMVGPSR
jgi:RNA 2',3'-cyclic 3'-phosphodiesterase